MSDHVLTVGIVSYCGCCAGMSCRSPGGCNRGGGHPYLVTEMTIQGDVGVVRIAGYPSSVD